MLLKNFESYNPNSSGGPQLWEGWNLAALGMLASVIQMSWIYAVMLHISPSHPLASVH